MLEGAKAISRKANESNAFSPFFLYFFSSLFLTSNTFPLTPLFLFSFSLLLTFYSHPVYVVHWISIEGRLRGSLRPFPPLLRVLFLLRTCTRISRITFLSRGFKVQPVWRRTTRIESNPCARPACDRFIRKLCTTPRNCISTVYHERTNNWNYAHVHRI